MIRYVKVKRTNTEEIRSLIHKFCDETNAGDEARDIILHRLPAMVIYAALSESGIVGIGGYYTLDAKKAIFDFLYVVPEQRNKSIAGRLHKLGTKHAKEHGIEKVIVFTKPDTAKRYLKLGGYSTVFHVLEKSL